jgi:hypothetical protein
MRNIILLSLAASVLLLAGCGKQESPSETPAVNNAESAATNAEKEATNAEKEATNAMPETHKPGPGQ